MAHTLNMTLRMKQDPETLAKIKHVREVFATQIQPAIDAALKKSELVHYARVVIIDDKYIQVLTEFDGDPKVYTTFFLKALPEVFKTIFSLGENVPSWEELQDEDRFFETTAGLNVASLGAQADAPGAGYMFQAFGNTTVKEMKAALAKA